MKKTYILKTRNVHTTSRWENTVHTECGHSTPKALPGDHTGTIWKWEEATAEDLAEIAKTEAAWRKFNAEMGGLSWY